jgi:hypothetical protein
MGLNGIVLKACESQAAKRFRSAGELESALAQLAQEVGGLRRDGQGGGIGRPGNGTRVVILCPSAADTDGSLAKSLAGRLGEQGFGIFVDNKTTLSVEWARGIEQQIRGAQVVVPILSPATAQSEMMAYGLEIAQQCARGPTRFPRLVAVCVDLPAPMPRHLALALEGAILIPADGTMDQEKVVGEILSAVRSSVNADSTTQ